MKTTTTKKKHYTKSEKREKLKNHLHRVIYNNFTITHHKIPHDSFQVAKQ